MPEAGLPRSRRLPDANAFAAVLRRGYRSQDGCFTVYALPNAQDHARLGLAVSRKVSPRAVVRNRIKRQVRESFRHHQGMLKGLDVVTLARARAARESGAAIRSSLEHHWQRIKKQCAHS